MSLAPAGSPTAGPTAVRPLTDCPTCGSGDRTELLHRRRVPVFNNVLHRDEAEARSAATGDVRLVACAACGLIRNAAFEPDLVRYGPDYENSLHGSAVFSSWARGLAERLAADHLAEGGHVLEVGAGSGEFLAVLCEVAGCTGVGIDPSHDADDRRAAGDRSRVLVQDAPVRTTADLVVCRHVLEHVADPVGLLRGTAAAVEARSGGPGVPVYVEVPDARHMVQAEAVWDVIYEHPLYFDEATLRAVLSAAGIAPVRTGRTFGGQFAWIEGRIGGGPAAPPPIPPALDGGAAARFGAAHERRVARAEADVSAALERGAVVVWGAGSKGVTFCTSVPSAARAVVVDVNARKHGRHLPLTGQAVRGPASLRGLDVALVVVMNGAYEDEVRAALSELDVDAQVRVG